MIGTNSSGAMTMGTTAYYTLSSNHCDSTDSNWGNEPTSCCYRSEDEDSFLLWWNHRVESLATVIRLARISWIPRIVLLVRKRFERRSEPRWSDLRWKSKT